MSKRTPSKVTRVVRNKVHQDHLILFSAPLARSQQPLLDCELRGELTGRMLDDRVRLRTI